MEHLIQTLLTMTATASVGAVCVMVLRLPLKRAPRWIPCALWLVVFLRMVCPTGLSLPVSLVPQGVSNGSYVEDILPTAPQAAPEEPIPTVPIQETGVSMPATPVTRTETPDTSAPLWPVALTVIWAAGTAAALLWAVVSYGRLRRRIADAVLIEENIYETDQIDTPFVCGFFWPRIYLPVTLNGEDRRYVLLHEQAHIRRGDHLAKPLAYLILCIHWFNPVLWLAYRLLCRDIETACDQAVIRSFDRCDTAQYAAALLHLGRKPSLPSAVPLAFGEEDAKGRVRSVLSYKKPAFWLVVAAVAACVVAGVLLLADSRHQLEHDDIIFGRVWINNELVTFPLDLRNELIDLINQYDGTQVEQPVTDPQAIWANGRVTLDTASSDDVYAKIQGSSYSFFEYHGSLVFRVDDYPGGDQVISTPYQTSPDFQTAYQAWYAKLDDYLWVTRPDELFAIRDQQFQTEEAISALLNRLGLANAIGGYTLELDQSVTPCALTISLMGPPVLSQDTELFSAFLANFEPVLFSITDDIGAIYWVFGTPGDPHYSTAHTSHQSDPGIRDPEAFRKAYRAMKIRVQAYRASMDDGRYAIRQVCYLSPQLSETVTEADIAASIYKFEFLEFSSSADFGTGAESNYRDPYYRYSQDLTPANDFLSAYGVDPAQHPGQAICTVIQDAHTQDTGYRIYEWDGNVFLAHFDLTGGGETLEYLVQLRT